MHRPAPLPARESMRALRASWSRLCRRCAADRIRCWWLVDGATFRSRWPHGCRLPGFGEACMTGWRALAMTPRATMFVGSFSRTDWQIAMAGANWFSPLSPLCTVTVLDGVRRQRDHPLQGTPTSSAYSPPVLKQLAEMMLQRNRANAGPHGRHAGDRKLHGPTVRRLHAWRPVAPTPCCPTDWPELAASTSTWAIASAVCPRRGERPPLPRGFAGPRDPPPPTQWSTACGPAANASPRANLIQQHGQTMIGRDQLSDLPDRFAAAGDSTIQMPGAPQKFAQVRQKRRIAQIHLPSARSIGSIPAAVFPAWCISTPSR